MGKGSQDDFNDAKIWLEPENDAKIWLEPEIEVARPGRTLKRHALGQALKVILDTFALDMRERKNHETGQGRSVLKILH